VADFMERLSARRAVNGTANWIACSCQEGIDPPAPWYVGCMHDREGAFIVQLLCSACENDLDVVNGRLS
jgi:hypothetical protein